MISVHDDLRSLAFGSLSGFRDEFHRCLVMRSDALFELTDAVLCAGGPVGSLVELSLVPEHRRGHGALYDAVNAGRVEFGRLRNLVALQEIPRCDTGEGQRRMVLAVDVSAWPRPEAVTSADRLLCHTGKRGQAQVTPGWPYSFVAALEQGRSSWCAPLDARRLGPADNVTEVTAAQVRDVATALIAAGAWTQGDPEIWLVADSGYEGPRLAYLLRDLPIQVIVRLRSDRVMYFPAPQQRDGQPNGRPMRHGRKFTCKLSAKQASTLPEPDHITATGTGNYGQVIAAAWDRLHPMLVRRDSWSDHPPGDLPILEGTIIQVSVDRLPGDRHPGPMWLWYSATGPTSTLMDRIWQLYLRRFDLEHTFRFLKQTLGWTRPRLRHPDAADRWTWLLIAAYTQLRLTRALATDLRRPWEKPSHRPDRPDRLSPTRVRRGFRYLRPKTTLPASAPKPNRPGPGRPPGTPNTRRAPRHTPGKNHKTDNVIKCPQGQTG